jgi:PAS domain S-box-containing protein
MSPRNAGKNGDAENKALRTRLEELEETLRAIQSGTADGVVVHGPEGSRVFVLESADLPYRLLVEAMSESAMIVSPVGIILHANGSFGRLLDVPMERVIGFPLSTFAVRDDRERLDDLLRLGARRPENAELSFSDRAGSRLPAKVSVSSMRVQGAPVLSVVVTDLRAREENREHLAARRRLTFLAEAGRVLTSTLEPPEILDLIARLALDGIADWVAVDLRQNDGALSRVTIAHRDPAKKAWAKEFMRNHPFLAEDPQAAYLQAYRTGRSLLFTQLTENDTRVRNAQPEMRDLVRTLGLTSAMVVPMKGRHDTIGVISFVSSDPAHRYGEADLSMAESLAARAGLALENSRLYMESQDAVASREQFLSIASHELGTPLTTLQIQIQHAMRKLRQVSDSPVSQEVLPLVSSANAQCQVLIRLIGRLLDLSRIRAGRITLDPERIDLQDVLHGVVERFKAQLQHSGNRLRMQSTSVVGTWDRLRIEQVLTNLLSNAIKFGAGKPIHVSLDSGDGKALFVVRDSGIGMDPEFIERIFRPFEQAKSESAGRGLGLGLFITNEIVRAHGGKIAVRSAPGAGSQFTVELPLGAAAPPPEKRRPRARQASKK